MSAIAQFSSPASHDLPFPYELASLIVEHISDLGGNVPADCATLDALSQSGPIFRTLCQPLLFRTVVLNFRRQDVQRRTEQFTALLSENTRLAGWVRRLRIYDNEIRPTSGWDIIAPSPLKVVDAVELGAIGQQFSFDVEKLTKLEEFIVSFVCGPLEWMQVPVHFQRMVWSATRCPNLDTLYIQGFNQLPRSLLARFSKLTKLALLDVSIDSSSVTLDQPNYSTQELPTASRTRLQVLGLRNVPAEGALSLLEFWRSDADYSGHPGIDMSRPEMLDLTFNGKITECQIPTQAVYLSSEQTKYLRLDMSFLKFDIGNLLDPPAPIIRHWSTYPSVVDWFTAQIMSLLDPGALSYLTSLEYVEITASYWVGGHVEVLGDIIWALWFLEQIPTTHLRGVFFSLKVGSHDMGRILSNPGGCFAGWNGELQKEKWAQLKVFSFVVRFEGQVDATEFETLSLAFRDKITYILPTDAFKSRQTRFTIRFAATSTDGSRLRKSTAFI